MSVNVLGLIVCMTKSSLGVSLTASFLADGGLCFGGSEPLGVPLSSCAHLAGSSDSSNPSEIHIARLQKLILSYWQILSLLHVSCFTALFCFDSCCVSSVPSSVVPLAVLIHRSSSRK